jgi:uncharacterized GH25 family protein
VIARLLIGLFGLCWSASIAVAHDFWVQPIDYWINSNATTSFTLQVGHGPFRQRSPIPTRRITRFEALGPADASFDLRGNLRVGEAADDGNFRFENPGTYVLVLQTDDNAQTHLPSIRFNDYLRAEGLTPALEARARMHRTDADGSERYSRCAKSLVQVGSTVGVVSKPVGLPLEIVPETNPYGAPRPATLPVRVIYMGQPLSGALVKLTNLGNDASPFEVHETDRDGRAVFPMPASGTWLINVIWTKESSASGETDFETVFSSLSFGYSSTVH